MNDISKEKVQTTLTTTAIVPESVPAVPPEVAHRVCDWWTNVNCGDSLGLYDNNNELYRDVEGNLIAG
ncbi:hypothetical protein RP20_CCG005946 [Aedes albopictus]|nr:hypothetical protein RP20_CCG005946 [Aedes albopictus]